MSSVIPSELLANGKQHPKTHGIPREDGLLTLIMITDHDSKSITPWPAKKRGYIETRARVQVRRHVRAAGGSFTGTDTGRRPLQPEECLDLLIGVIIANIKFDVNNNNNSGQQLDTGRLIIMVLVVAKDHSLNK